MIGDSNLSRPEAMPPVMALTGEPTDADVTERLLGEFEATHGLRLMSAVIRACRAELRKSAPGSGPQMLEALVRGRLAALKSVPVEIGAA